MLKIYIVVNNKKEITKIKTFYKKYFTHVPNCPVICCFPLSNCLIILESPKSEIFTFVLSVGLSIFSVRRILKIKI